MFRIGKIDKQSAAAYASAMIVDSYYGCHCSMPCRKWFLHYQELPREKQYQMEDMVIRQMDRLGEGVLGIISGLRYDLQAGMQGGELVLLFQAYGEGTLRCGITESGRVVVSLV